MSNESPHSPLRFEDPLGSHMQELSLAHRQRLESFPPVASVYQGFYARFKPQNEDGMHYVGGAWGIVGSELTLTNFADGLGFAAQDGQQVALLDTRLAARLDELRERGWTVHCVLAFTIYRAAEGAFEGEFACFCYSPELTETQRQAVQTFIKHITERITGAFHPKLELSQEQFIRVLESGGAWYLTKDIPWPELPKGTVFYRRRRTFSDRLVSAGVRGNKGCLVASWGVIVLIVAALVAALWYFFFS
jgi:hypothetical protein